MTEESVEEPLMEFDSHVAGKNAMVRLYPDRIEYTQGGRLGTKGKAALGVATVGLSFLATGVRGRQDIDVILVRSISSVKSKRSGLLWNEVVVNADGQAVGFRCSQKESEEFRSRLLQLLSKK